MCCYLPVIAFSVAAKQRFSQARAQFFTLTMYIRIFKEYAMTTTSKSPLLQVHGQDGQVMLANITGTNNPVAVLEDKVLDLLFVQCRKARAEALKTGGDASPTLELCTTLDGVLKSYRKMRDEYHHRLDIELERDEAEQRLQEAMNALKKP
jgi:hypothetical protein